MIVNDVGVTPVYSLWHITMCAGHVSQLLNKHSNSDFTKKCMADKNGELSKREL